MTLSIHYLRQTSPPSMRWSENLMCWLVLFIWSRPFPACWYIGMFCYSTRYLRLRHSVTRLKTSTVRYTSAHRSRQWTEWKSYITTGRMFFHWKCSLNSFQQPEMESPFPYRFLRGYRSPSPIWPLWSFWYVRVDAMHSPEWSIFLYTDTLC